MSAFPKMSDRIELSDGSWLNIYRFEPLDENRANIEFTYIGKNKRRREKRIGKKVPNMNINVWRFQYDGKAIFFEV